MTESQLVKLQLTVIAFKIEAVSAVVELLLLWSYSVAFGHMLLQTRVYAEQCPAAQGQSTLQCSCLRTGFKLCQRPYELDKIFSTFSSVGKKTRQTEIPSLWI